MASNKRKGGNYSTAERNSYKKGFFAGLFTARKKNSNVPKTKKRTPFNSVSEIPNHYQHNVLFSDERYVNIYRHYTREMGMEHEKARDYALHMYKKEYGDKVLRKHYEL